MPFNGSGTFTVVNTFIPNTTILSSAVNANFTDIASGLSNCLTRDGQAGMTAALKVINGSAGAPSVSFSSDPTTGMWLLSSGTLIFSAGGNAGLSLDSDGITTLSPTAVANNYLILSGASTSSNINTLATAGTGLINSSNTTNWPDPGYLLVNKELMSYTVASANGLTITERGIWNTTPVSHATGAGMRYMFSGFSFSNSLVPNRATAGRPAFPRAGEFGYNNTSGQLEYYSNGWVSINPTNVQPQGYLSTIAGTPIVTTDQTSQTTLYYNPYQGNVIPVPTNGVFNLQTFSTAAIALSASQTTNGIYDIYGFISTTNSTLTFGISPSWAAGSGGSVAPGSCARGTGAGGTALTVVNGLPTNAVGMTILNGASSYTIATNSGIYLGSIYIGATAGTVNLHRSYGQNRQWGVWNAFNSAPVYLKAGDATASWTYTTSTFRASDNTTANSLSIFSGLATDIYSIEFLERITVASASTTQQIAVGLNTATTSFGFVGAFSQGSSTSMSTVLHARYLSAPSLGVNTVNAMESGSTGATFLGTEANMRLSTEWKA